MYHRKNQKRSTNASTCKDEPAHACQHNQQARVHKDKTSTQWLTCTASMGTTGNRKHANALADTQARRTHNDNATVEVSITVTVHSKQHQSWQLVHEDEQSKCCKTVPCRSLYNGFHVPPFVASKARYLALASARGGIFTGLERKLISVEVEGGKLFRPPPPSGG